MGRSAVSPRRLADLAAYAAVVAAGLWVLDPVWRGRMPLSADHTVHLTRIHLWREVLAAGHLRGFRPEWGFGVPIGEFYPILGDALVLLCDTVLPGGLRVAYAAGFTAAFLSQGLATAHLAHRLGMGPAAVAAAGTAVLLDLGAYREGGFVYTVDYGVWPQALSTALLVVSVAEAVRALDGGRACSPRSLAAAGGAFGLALLAHPMALAAGTVFWGFLLLAHAAERPCAANVVLLRTAVAAAFGLALAAFFVAPMLHFRGYMAAYGWLGLPMDFLRHQLARGAFAQGVVPVATGLALAGLASAFGSRDAGLRAVAAATVVLFLLAAAETFWILRLDRLGEGFTRIQYQRFLAVAKFGGYVLAARGIDLLRTAASAVLRPLPRWRPAAHLAAAGLAAGLVADQVRVLQRHGARPQVERYPGHPEAEAAWHGLARAMAEHMARDQGFVRFAARAPRNRHDLVDLSVETGAALYKIGFTPGDNFVHKPEHARREVLDALGVRYVVGRIRGRPPRGLDVPWWDPPFALQRRKGAKPRPVAWLEGPGRLTIEVDDRTRPYVRGRVEGAGPDTRIVFGIAGHPRFHLTQNGHEVPWVETPVHGDASDVRPQDRLSGRVRGGKAMGDDGSEPILIAAPVRNGPFELRYAATTRFDRVAGAASLAAAAVLLLLLAAPARTRPLLTRLERAACRRLPRATFPALLALAAVAAGVRYGARAWTERSHLYARVETGGLRRARPGPVKTDMRIRPALLLAPREGRPARVRVGGVEAGRYVGFWAFDDDRAKQRPGGRATLTIAVHLPGGGPPLRQTHHLPVRPGSRPLVVEVPSAGSTLELVAEATGTPPPVAVDLWPEDPP